MDKICRLLALDEKPEEKDLKMKYKKYNHVDLSNIKQISANNVELNKMPEWIPLCRNLKIILLEHNNLKG